MRERSLRVAIGRSQSSLDPDNLRGRNATDRIKTTSRAETGDRIAACSSRAGRAKDSNSSREDRSGKGAILTPSWIL